jgi:hypothetical protein
MQKKHLNRLVVSLVLGALGLVLTTVLGWNQATGQTHHHHTSSGLGNERLHSTAHHPHNSLYMVSGINMSLNAQPDHRELMHSSSIMLMWDHELGHHFGVETLYEHAMGDHAGDALAVMLSYHLGEHVMLGTGPGYGTNGAAWHTEAGLDWTWMDWHVGPTVELHMTPNHPSLLYTGVHIGHAIGE